jgi:hypothetical protein
MISSRNEVSINDFIIIVSNIDLNSQFETRIHLELGVSRRRTLTRYRHILLYLIMSFS